jgi:hypothetical protein
MSQKLNLQLQEKRFLKRESKALIYLRKQMKLFLFTNKLNTGLNFIVFVLLSATFNAHAFRLSCEAMKSCSPQQNTQLALDAIIKQNAANSAAILQSIGTVAQQGVDTAQQLSVLAQSLASLAKSISELHSSIVSLHEKFDDFMQQMPGMLSDNSRKDRLIALSGALRTITLQAGYLVEAKYPESQIYLNTIRAAALEADLRVSELEESTDPLAAVAVQAAANVLPFAYLVTGQNVATRQTFKRLLAWQDRIENPELGTFGTELKKGLAEVNGKSDSLKEMIKSVNTSDSGEYQFACSRYEEDPEYTKKLTDMINAVQKAPPPQGPPPTILGQHIEAGFMCDLAYVHDCPGDRIKIVDPTTKNLTPIFVYSKNYDRLGLAGLSTQSLIVQLPAADRPAENEYFLTTIKIVADSASSSNGEVQLTINRVQSYLTGVEASTWFVKRVIEGTLHMLLKVDPNDSYASQVCGNSGSTVHLRLPILDNKLQRRGMMDFANKNSFHGDAAYQKLQGVVSELNEKRKRYAPIANLKVALIQSRAAMQKQLQVLGD